MNRTLSLAFALVLAGIPVGQAEKPSARRATFHVEGIIDDPVNAVVPNVEIHFVGDKAEQTVTTDDNGRYQTDLPVGTYTMTADSPASGPNHISFFTKYVRFFRVQSPMTVNINGTLYPIYSCDGVWGEGKEAQEVYKDDCGGEDSFSFPARDGTPFHLDIHYVRREREEKLVSYSSSVIQRPVLVAYNLFGLKADSVDYNARDGTIRAYGHVIFEDQSGHASVASAGFKFADGEATRLW